MRPLLLITSTLSDGRPWRLMLWPLAASLAVFILVLAILAPTLARAERSAAAGPAPESTSAGPPPAVDAVPSYSVAVGIDAVDRVLEPYGGFGALPRSKQESNYFLTQELLQLESMATFVPFIFLAVAAFLLNIVIARMVQAEREETRTDQGRHHGIEPARQGLGDANHGLDIRRER